MDIIKNLFKTLIKLETIKKSGCKYSTVLFPLMKFLKTTFNFQNGQFKDSLMTTKENTDLSVLSHTIDLNRSDNKDYLPNPSFLGDSTFAAFQ